MSTPLTTQPADKVALLPPQLFGSVAYYAAMAQYRKAVVDTSLRYDKRFKSVHRYSIADARGEPRLTVPVSRPEGAFLAGNLTWQDVTVSAHGRWWEVHLQALESAYGRTPFFEFYIDRFASVLKAEGQSICSMVLEADAIIRNVLGIDTEIIGREDVGDTFDDYSRVDFSKIPAPQTYWQLRAANYGFLPKLSILDLIFNLGPESPLLLISDEKTNFAI